MAQVKNGDVVKVHYTVRLEDGTVFDSTKDHEPFMLTIGLGQVLPSFEEALMEMKPGETKTIKVPAEEAYGLHSEELITKVERNVFPEDFKFEVGQNLQIQEGGQETVVTVKEVTDSAVTFDKNHPLAGKDLIMDIELLEILS